MRGATTVRDLWAELKESVGTALDRVHPGVLIVTGLAAVVIAFGALGLAMLADGDRASTTSASAPRPDRAAEGDAASGTGGRVRRPSAATRCPTASRPTGRAPGGRSDGPAGDRTGTGENAMADRRRSVAGRGGDRRRRQPPTTGPDHDVAPVPPTDGARHDGHDRAPRHAAPPRRPGSPA